MRITVTARHCEIGADLRTRAAEVMERLGQLTPFGQEATVVFDRSAGHEVELRVHLSGGNVMIAAGAGVDHRSALDQAAGRMRRQLRRPPARRGPRRGAAPA